MSYNKLFLYNSFTNLLFLHFPICITLSDFLHLFCLMLFFVVLPTSISCVLYIFYSLFPFFHLSSLQLQTSSSPTFPYDISFSIKYIFYYYSIVLHFCQILNIYIFQEFLMHLSFIYLPYSRLYLYYCPSVFGFVSLLRDRFFNILIFPFSSFYLFLPVLAAAPDKPYFFYSNMLSLFTSSYCLLSLHNTCIPPLLYTPPIFFLTVSYISRY